MAQMLSMSAYSMHFSAQLSSKVAACPMTTEMDAFNPQKKKGVTVCIAEPQFVFITRG